MNSIILDSLNFDQNLMNNYIFKHHRRGFGKLKIKSQKSGD